MDFKYNFLMDNDFIIDDSLEISDSIFLDPDESKWENLIDQIVKGNVIPVIGPGILLDGKDINQKAIDFLAKKSEMDERPNTYSELVFNPQFRFKDNIYSWLAQIATANSFKPSSLLKRIFSIKQFPFVITTSFFPVVETAMKEIWAPRTVKVMKFNNDPVTTNTLGVGDIREDRDIKDPTVYYMFGNPDKAAHKFVVTDTDMLSFCKSWMSNDSRPRNLSNVLRNKYLLVFGSNYPDWLFRFIWYSINQSGDSLSHSMVEKPGMVVEETADPGLLEFLNRVDTFTQKDPYQVVDTIEAKLKEREAEIEAHRFDYAKKYTNVFISYSRVDQKAADTLYESLSSLGLDVWYDRRKLKLGSDFTQEIEDAINSTQFFIQIMSPEALAMGDEYHYYVKERNIALERAEGFNRTFFIPLVHKSLDIYNSDLPKRIRSLNAAFYDNDMDFSVLAQELLDNVNALNKK